MNKCRQTDILEMNGCVDCDTEDVEEELHSLFSYQTFDDQHTD